MFAPHGWISLFEVYHWLDGYLRTHNRIGEIEFTGDEPYELTWEFAELATEVAVCLPDGTSLPIARTVVVGGGYDSENGYVHLHYGTIGSSESYIHDHKDATESFIKLCGPFKYLPIIFPRDDFEQYIEMLISGDDKEDEKHDDSPKSTSIRILNEFNQGVCVTFSEIKAKVAPKQSVRQFRFAWQLAKEQEPNLSKPGRRPRKT